MTDDADPVIKHLRDQISDADRQLIELVNRRLKLVEQLKRYKESRGIGFLDPEREEWMLSYLQRANSGPLSWQGWRSSSPSSWRLRNGRSPAPSLRRWTLDAHDRQALLCNDCDSSDLDVGLVAAPRARRERPLVPTSNRFARRPSSGKVFSYLETDELAHRHTHRPRNSTRGVPAPASSERGGLPARVGRARAPGPVLVRRLG